MINLDDDTSDEELEYMSEPTAREAAGHEDGGITVTVNARALDTILEAAAHRIALQTREQVTKMVQQRLDALLDQAWKDSVGAMARDSIDTYLTKPRVKTNGYGEPISGSATTLSEMIPKTVQDWLSKQVDDKGRDTDYNRGTTRLQWIVSSMVIAQVDAETTKAVQQVTAQARQVVANHVAKFVSEQMVPAIELARG